MKYEKLKLLKDPKGQIVSLPYDDNVDYYAFLRQCRADRYSQIIISSEIMTEIIKHMCLNKNYAIYRIELIEPDSDLEDEIETILRKIENNAGYLGELIEKLRFLTERSSIDLKSVYLKEKYVPNKVPGNFFIQINGIVGINRESVDSVMDNISTVIARCL